MDDRPRYDDDELDEWRSQVNADASRWGSLRLHYDNWRRETAILKEAALSEEHPKWDIRYVELLLLISEGSEQARTPPLQLQLAERMGVKPQSSTNRYIELLRAGYIETFEHPHHRRRYYRLTEEGRQFLSRTLPDD